VQQLTGGNEVTWTKSGHVYHLCEDASAVNLESADNQIYAGTVEDAHTAGKDGLTLEVAQELQECGLEAPANLEEIEAEIRQLRETAE
jgi:predicted neutral ceramidase superfamily lipid hydrolase